MGRSLSTASSSTQIASKVITDVAVGSLAVFFDGLGIDKWSNPPALPFGQAMRLPFASLETSRAWRGSAIVPEAVAQDNHNGSCCTLTNGNVVITYSSNNNNLRFAIYKPDGTFVTPVTQVAAVTNTISRVAALANGGFVIFHNNGGNNACWVTYDSAGTPTNSGSNGGSCSDIAGCVLPTGDFIMAYVESGAAKFARYNAAGTQQGSVITTDASSVNNYIDATALPTGGFVVVWGSSAPSVKFGRYNNVGALQGSVVTLASSGVPSWPCVAAAPNGNFMIVWVDTSPNYPKYAVYSADGAVVKAVSKLTAQTGSSKLCICGLITGGFVVAYRQGNVLYFLDNTGTLDAATLKYSAVAGGVYLNELSALTDGGLMVFATNASNYPSFGFYSTYAVTIVGCVTSAAAAGGTAVIETFGVSPLADTYAEAKSFSYTGGSLPGNKGTVFNGSIYMKGLS